MDFIHGKKTLKDMIDLHDAHGFNVASDIPFAAFALDAFEQIEDCKVK